uniref:Histone-lysine N-methyltransferase SETD1 n=1 Tax=Cacopsylla melanoneura TaxID=428564 RepID=A0A8D8YP81_9HEMI
MDKVWTRAVGARIEMLLRGRLNVGGIPISSESEDETHHHGNHSNHNKQHHRRRTVSKPEEEGEEDAGVAADGPLSTPPSPFLSEEIYLNCFKRAIEMALEAKEREEQEARGFLENVEGFNDPLHSEISSSEDETLSRSVTQEIRKALNYSDLHAGEDDDRMSLSSLSSGDEKIQEVLQTGPPGGLPPHSGLVGGLVPHYPLGHHPPPHLAHLYAPAPPGALYPHAAGFWSPHPQHAAFVFHTAGTGVQVPPMGLALHPGGSHMTPTLASVVIPVPHEPSHSPQVQITNTLVDRLSKELKQILKRDINKKMVESIAYSALETWWDTELKKQSSAETIDETSTGVSTVGSTSETLPLPSADNYASLGSGGFGLLGFRASLPKMPSFRMKRKAPAPLSPKSKRVRKSTEDASSSSSEEEGLIKGSDDELDTGPTPPSPTRAPPSPAQSTSSKYSSSSSSSSSSSEQSESESEDEGVESESDRVLEDSDTATVRNSKALTPVSSDDNLPISVALSKRRRQSQDSSAPARTPTGADKKKRPVLSVYTPSEDSDSDVERPSKKDSEKKESKKSSPDVVEKRTGKKSTPTTPPQRKNKFIYSSSSSEDETEETPREESVARLSPDKKQTAADMDVSVVLDKVDLKQKEPEEEGEETVKEKKKKKEEEEKKPQL